MRPVIQAFALFTIAAVAKATVQRAPGSPDCSSTATPFKAPPRVPRKQRRR